MTHRWHHRIAVLLLCLAAPGAQAVEFVRQYMYAPLSPAGDRRATIGMPEGFDPSKEVWVAYRLYAVSAKAEPTGDVTMDGSFDTVPTPAHQASVAFSVHEMEIEPASADMSQRLEGAMAHRARGDLVAALGQDLHDAYAALRRGEGSMLVGTIHKTLPPPGDASLPLLVSVNSATDMLPVAVVVIVGQGDMPPDLVPPVSERPAFQVGRVLGILLMLGFGVWLFRRWRSD